jgi:hypothetical protein
MPEQKNDGTSSGPKESFAQRAETRFFAGDDRNLN